MLLVINIQLENYKSVCEEKSSVKRLSIVVVSLFFVFNVQASSINITGKGAFLIIKHLS